MLAVRLISIVIKQPNAGPVGQSDSTTTAKSRVSMRYVGYNYSCATTITIVQLNFSSIAVSRVALSSVFGGHFL